MQDPGKLGREPVSNVPSWNSVTSNTNGLFISWVGDRSGLQRKILSFPVTLLEAIWWYWDRSWTVRFDTITGN